jgi:hypothetical protein
MKISLRGVAILAASASLLTVPMALPASAAAAVPQCKKLTTKTVKTTVNVTLTTCTPTTATGGKGTGTFKSNPNKSGTFLLAIKWAGGKGTTKATVTFKGATTKGKCPKTSTGRVTLGGSVTGGSGAAVKTIKPKQKIVGSVCSSAKSGYTVEPGTTLKF